MTCILLFYVDRFMLVMQLEDQMITVMLIANLHRFVKEVLDFSLNIFQANSINVHNRVVVSV